ncbi:alpha/beta fold hydrolase [Agrobacterium sp. CG674]
MATVALFSFTSTAQPVAVTDQTIEVAGQTFRYLSAGKQGNVIVLLHGWPQSADEFSGLMSELAETYVVYAPDLSGIGGTNAPDQRWDKASLAEDMKSFVDALGVEDPLIVGHDIGGMVAYAYGRLYPEEVSGVAVLDVPIPGLAPWDLVAGSPQAWHFDFHAQRGLAETLVTGKERDYLRYFMDKVSAQPGVITDEAIKTYAEAYGTPDRLRAGFELYRSFKEDIVFFQRKNEEFKVPMLVVGAEFSTAAALPLMAQSYAAQGVTNLRTLTVNQSGHWLAEEQAEPTLNAIETFAVEVFNR